MTKYKTTFRDRLVFWGCNLLINWIASPPYRAYLSVVLVKGKKSLEEELRNSSD